MLQPVSQLPATRLPFQLMGGFCNDEMQFSIMSKQVLEASLAGNRQLPVGPFVVISIASPGQSFPTLEHSQLVGALRLSFHDADQPVSSLKATELFQPEQADQILDFMEEYRHRVDHCICQCEAGISRSAAVAAALSRLINGNDQHIWDDRKYLPNRLVYRTILQQAALRETDLEDLELTLGLPGVFISPGSQTIN